MSSRQNSGYARKKHGPRYGVKGKPGSWVVRDKTGKFKDWKGKKESLAVDNAKKAERKPTKPGCGNQGDY